MRRRDAATITIMRRYLVAIAAMSAILTGCGTDRNSGESPAAAASQSPYVGQPLPGLTPERFAPGLVSTDAIELNGVFSPDLREFYFTRVVDGVDTMHQIIGRQSDILAFTSRGSRVIYLCGRDFMRTAQRTPEDGRAVVIHEMLHSLGLGENPPSSREITRRVRERCWR